MNYAKLMTRCDATAVSDEPAAWDEFLKAGQDLRLWIASQGLKLNTEQEKQVFRQMSEAYEGYMQKAEDLHGRMESSRQPGASLAEYTEFHEQSRRLFNLGQELGRAHYEPRYQLRAQVAQTLAHLRLVVLLLVALLFLFGVALAWGVYHYLIAPLRIELVESRALAERNEKLASLGMLAAGVAHEIRNPLTAIKTAVFLQQKNLPPGSPEHKDGEVVEREISRLERIVNEFLQFARPAQPKLAIVEAETPLQEVEALLGPQLATADIRLVRETSEPMRMQADPAQIKQVLINLVQNAADSIGRGGTITLRAHSGRKRLAGGETEVAILEVADTGKGIPPEVEKRLFDPFFTTKDHGTGLGLSLASCLVEMNGGALHYETQVGRGSTFGIILRRVS